MEIDTNIRHKIPKKHWVMLRDIYKIYWPRHSLSYYTLKTFIEWMEQNPKLDINIFTSDEDWQMHGTYVIMDRSGPRFNVLFNTLNAEKYDQLLFRAFENIPIDRPFTLAAFVDQVRFISNKFLVRRQAMREGSYDTLLYYLPLKESLQFRKETKPGYDIKKLSLDDVQLINDAWPHRYPGSDIFFENLIRYNLSLGAYEEGTGMLRGWVMQDQTGSIGLLQIKDPCKRQDLGEQLVIYMAVLLANAGMDAIATVLSTNRLSRKLFHKLGFKIIGRAFWQDITPLKKEKKLQKNGAISCI